MNNQRPPDDDGSMGIGSPDLPYSHVAEFWRVDFHRTGHHCTEIAFIIAVQMPLNGIRTRIEGWHDARIDIDAHQKHAAIDTGAQHIGLMMIGRAKPAPCLRDHSGSLFLFRHLFQYIESSGGGTKGKPRKLARLLNRLWQVAMVLSQPL